jgi:hypothetical protein
MNIVLYTTDFEPITVLDLPNHVLEHLETHTRVRIPILDNSGNRGPRNIVLELDYITWLDSTKKPVILTHDLELALELLPEWLPGQRAQVNQWQQHIDQLKQLLQRAINQLKYYRE